jgi:hypothetical protein
VSESGGWWKAPPAVWLTLAGWILSLGIQLGTLMAMKHEVEELKTYVRSNIRSRAEGDEIIKRLDNLDMINTMRIDRLETRMDSHGIKP